MGMPDVDEIEIAGGVKEVCHKYGDVIGENQARNIVYTALIGARGAKIRANDTKPKPCTCGQAGHGNAHEPGCPRR